MKWIADFYLQSSDHVVVLPHIEHNQLIPSMHYESLSAGDSSPCADSIIAYTLAARIKDISLQRGVGLIPSAAFGTAHLWDRFAFRVHKTLVEINSDMMLEASLGRNKIFNKIHALVGTEVGSFVDGLQNNDSTDSLSSSCYNLPAGKLT